MCKYWAWNRQEFQLILIDSPGKFLDIYQKSGAKPVQSSWFLNSELLICLMLWKSSRKYSDVGSSCFPLLAFGRLMDWCRSGAPPTQLDFPLRLLTQHFISFLWRLHRKHDETTGFMWKSSVFQLLTLWIWHKRVVAPSLESSIFSLEMIFGAFRFNLLNS